jgi:putative nucleotidyltransferase with HDIG domain
MIKRELISGLKEEFVHYTNQFKSNDFFVQQHFKVKQKHTFNVCDNILAIGSRLGLDPQQLLIAEIIALFHDIGRFEQYNQYQTFSDFDSVNHSELGIEIIKERNFLKMLPIKTKQLVLDAIFNHNTPKVPENLNSDLALYSKLIRDADKLDIFRVLREYDMQENPLQKNNFNDYKIPDVILNAFNRRNTVLLTPGMSQCDFHLFRVSWIFDINFHPTFQMLDQQNHLQYFLSKLPKCYRLMNIQNIVREYMVEKIFTYA